MGFLEELEAAVYVKYALVLVGLFVLGITVWKGVHGFWPTAGLLTGLATLVVGLKFDKIYR